MAAIRGSLQGRHEYGRFRVMFRDMVDAIWARWTLEIDYQAYGKEEPRTHRVEPYLVHCQAGTVYLVGRIVGKDTLTTLALDRIEAMRVHDDELFVRNADFDPETFVDESFGGWHEGDVVAVRVRFDPPVATIIRERTWHPSQQIVEREGGGLDLLLETAGPTGVLHWTKSYLPNARIIEPAWLAERQRADADAWVERLRK
jgi:proteasome accessory factor B